MFKLIERFITWLYGAPVSSDDNFTIPAYPDTPLEAPKTSPDTITSTKPLETPPSASQKVYKVAYDSIGKHLTLNDSIRPEVGCAQAISWILINAGYPIPRGGISTVAGLTKWMLEQGFVEEKKYGVGYVITGRVNSTTAHIGVCGKDWIISNTSYTDTKRGLVAGQFQANYRKENWKKVYPQTRFFRPINVLA